MKKKTESKSSLDEKFMKLIQNKYVVILFLVIITIVFFVNYSKNFDTKLDQGGDNIYYLSLGKALHDGDGYSNTIGFEVKPHTHFPPGYPMFIAFIMNFFPDDVTAIKIANGILLYLAIIVLFFLFPVSTNNKFISFIMCLLCCMQKDLLHYASIIMSESLYIFLSISAIYILFRLINLDNKRIKKRENLILIVVFLLLISYIYLVRTMGLSLIIAFILGLVVVIADMFFKWRKRVKTCDATEAYKTKKELKFYSILLIFTVLVFVITMKAWQYRNNESGVVSNTYVSNFSKKDNGEVMSTKSDWVKRIKSNTSNYVTKWIPETMLNVHYDINSKITAKQWAIGLFLVVLMIFGVIGMKHCRWYMLFYLCVTMAVLILYPEQYGGNRYYVPIIPLFIFLCISGLSKIIDIIMTLVKAKSASMTTQSIVILLISLIFLFPSYLRSQNENRMIATYKSWDKIAVKQFIDYVEAAKWCGENLPDTTRVICRKPEVFYAYSNYHKAESFPWYAEPDSILNYLTKKKATHVIIDSWFKHAYLTLVPAINKHSDKFLNIKTISEIDTIKMIDATYIFEFHPEWGYHGEYVDGKKEGKGRYQWANGTFYEGEFSNDMINGYGKFTGLHGTYSEGYWVDEKKNGEGEERFIDSTFYRGTFKNDLPNGYGEYFDKNGSLLVQCHWVNGNKEGEGLEYFKDGRKYKGSFKNNMPNGYGEYYDSDGKLIVKGIWENGNLIDSL